MVVVALVPLPEPQAVAAQARAKIVSDRTVSPGPVRWRSEAVFGRPVPLPPDGTLEG